MDNLEPKKLALLRILQILEKYSDCEHPLTQEKIAKYLISDFGIDIERKAIGRNISLLKEAGIDIVSAKDGCYLDGRQFENTELRLLIDGVLASKHVTASHSKQLIEKLCQLSNIYFRSHVKHVYSVNDWNKTDNQALFLNIELVDEAIECGKQIKFDYNKYGTDKKLHKSATHTVSPYQLILHNQRYYLMALNEKWQSMTYYRLDHITNMSIAEDSVLTPLRSLAGYENGIDYKEFSASRPYMYPDKAETVVFEADANMADQIIDWFGFDTRLQEENGKIKVTVRVSPYAMEYWVMQYLNYVEVLSPESLREKIKKNVLNAAKKYDT